MSTNQRQTCETTRPGGPGSPERSGTVDDKYRAVVEGSLVGIVVHQDGVIRFANPAAVRLFGYDHAEELLGRDNFATMVAAEVRPELLQRTAAFYRGEQLPPHPGWRAIHKDGRELWVSTTGSLIEWEGRPAILAVYSDITERKQAEERLRTVLQATGVGLWLNEMPFGRLTWDARTRELFFVPPDAEPTIELFWSRLHPEDREPTRQAVEAALRDHTLYAIDHRAIDPVTGQVRWIHSEGKGTYDASGQVIRFDGINYDVSERMAAEHAIRESEERLRLATAATGVGIYDFHPQSREPTWSHECKAIWGFGPDTVVTPDVVLASVHPEDRESVERIVASSLDPRGPGEFSLEHRILRPDGSIRWVQVRGKTIFAESGGERRAIRALGTMLDITERKRVEEAERTRSRQVRRLAEIAAHLNAELDVHSIMRAVTDEARELLGTHQAVISLTTDQNWGQSVSAVSLSDRYAEWRSFDAKPDGSGIYALVCASNRPMRLTQAELEGHPAWKAFGSYAAEHPPIRGWLAAPLTRRDGQNMGLLQLSDKCDGEFTEDDEAILVQLAQMVSVALENARLVEHLRDADRRKDEFLATLAHELRNPLAPIRSAVSLLRWLGPPEPQLQRARDIIDRQVEHMVRLVDDLLDVSRITRGHLELQRDRVNLADVIQHAVETSGPLLEEGKHQLSVLMPSDPLVVEGDLVRLTQVVANLLNNAAKYTPDGGQVSLAVECEAEAAVIRVRDTGPGIPATMLDRVFEMFTQVNRHLDRSHGGLGIGLTLAKRLVELHKGTIEAFSRGEGQGAEFVVRLPRLLETNDESGESATKSAETAQRRILVVDDNRDAVEMLSLLLRMSGHEVRTAHDGLQGIEHASDFQPDLILLDLGMPGIDGFETARRIRQLPGGGGILLVALTGWGQEEDRRRTRAAGFDLHLAKPVAFAELEALLASLKSG